MLMMPTCGQCLRHANHLHAKVSQCEQELKIGIVFFCMSLYAGRFRSLHKGRKDRMECEMDITRGGHRGAHTDTDAMGCCPLEKIEGRVHALQGTNCRGSLTLFSTFWRLSFVPLWRHHVRPSTSHSTRKPAWIWRQSIKVVPILDEAAAGHAKSAKICMFGNEPKKKKRGVYCYP